MAITGRRAGPSSSRRRFGVAPARGAHERGAVMIVLTLDHRTLDVCDRTLEMEHGRILGESRASL